MREGILRYTAAVALCFVTTAWCERALALGLDDAVAEALQRNPALLAARQDLEIAGSGVVKARYLNQFNPELGASGSRREFDDGGGETQPAVDVSLEVEIAGQRGKRIDAAQRSFERVRAQIADAERVLRGRVTEAFYTVLHARERLELAREVEDLNRRFSAASNARFEAGDAPKMEPNLAAIRYSQARKDVLVAERDSLAALTEMETLLGRDPTGTLQLEGGLSVQRAPVPDGDLLVARALRDRPDLVASSEEVGRIEAEQALNRRLVVPNVTVGAFYEEEAEAGGGRDQIIGAGVRVPLPVFDRRQAELRELAGRHTQAEYERQALAASIRAEVNTALRAYRAASRAVEVYDVGALDQITENLTFVATAYREGKIDLLESIVVQNDLIEAKVAYLDSLLDYWRARAVLERAAGISSVTAAGPLTPTYEEDRHDK